MQTFLPFPCFTESAKALDNKRLGKQRVENLIRKDTVSYGDKFPGVPSNLEYVWPCQ